jgi:hypothetical protein
MSGLPKYLRLLFMALAGAVAFYAAAHLAREQRDAQNEVVQPAAPRVASAVLAAAPTPGAASTAASSPVERDPSLTIGDRSGAIPKAAGVLFPSLSWIPPAPPPPPPPPPPKPPEPVAPPMPFTFIGMLERGAAKPSAFLAKGDALLVVSAGDTVDNNNYRIDTLTAHEIVMTYLPLNIKQTLSVPGATK